MTTKEEIEQTWAKVFPNSLISISKGKLTGGLYCRCYLAKGKHEVPNKILENDILNYYFNVNENVYKETSISICTKPPVRSYLAFGNVKLHYKTIKILTLGQLEKRFLDVKKLVIDNKDNLPALLFDINDKF